MKLIPRVLQFGLIVLAFHIPFFRVLSQNQVNCSDLEIVFQDNSGVAEVKPAAIVTDPSGAAHLFWLYKQNKHDPFTWSIFYKTWQDGSWSEERDVLVTPGGGAGAPRVVYTSNGVLHVIWADQYSLWYASSLIKTAENARSWSTPKIIATYVIDADIATDPLDNLHIAYTSGQPTGPVYYIRSMDGNNWTTPSIVFQDSPVDATSGEVRLSVDEAERIHVTWTENQLPGGWPPLGQWYARSVDGGETWEDHKKVADGEQGQGIVLAVGDDVHLIWRGTSGSGNSYHRMSIDGGKTWRDPIIFDPDGGFSGNHTLAADSAGTLHLVRADGGYQVFQGGVWSPVPALFADSGEIGTVAIGLGNQIHWVNTSPAGSKEAVVYHRLCMSNAPIIVKEKIPNSLDTEIALVEATVTEPAPTAIPTIDPFLNQTPADIQPSSQPIVIATASIIILIFGIVAIRGVRKKG